MKNLFTLLLFSLLGIFTVQAQSKEEVPEFYKEMNSHSPNIYKVEELYKKYTETIPITFSEEELKHIKELKAMSKGEVSSWIAHAKKDNSSVKKEFRSDYEKDYIDWRKHVQPYIQADGSILYPTEEEFIKNFKTESVDHNSKSSKKTTLSSGGNPALTAQQLYGNNTTPIHSTYTGWRFFGPVQLLAPEGDRLVSSHANVRAFAQSQSNPNMLVCAVENGSIYISHNKGKMWHLATKGYHIRNITALAISQSDENVIYAGGGDHKHYVSRDGGVTWEYITPDSGYNSLRRASGPGNPTSKILAIKTDDDPLNDVVLFATTKGLLKLKQIKKVGGGVSYTFEQKLENTTTDIIKRVGHDNEYFALGYDTQKNHMYFYVSTDNGETWTRKGQNNGWFEPEARMTDCWGGRLAMSFNSPNIVYAYLIEDREKGDNGFLGVYRSEDGGENWTLPNTNGPGKGDKGYGNHNPNIVTFPWLLTNGYHQRFYNCAIVANPQDANSIILGGLNAYLSSDGGATFNKFGGYSGPKTLHPDMQTFYQQKNDDGTVDTWLTTDGGINYSSDFFNTENIVRTAGLGSDYWGFDLGEYNSNMGGGMYHNGNNYHVHSYGGGIFKRLGGSETSTGYVFPGEDERHMYFSDHSAIIAPKSVNETPKSAPKPDPYPNEPYAGRDTYYTQRDFRGNTYYHKQTKDDINNGQVKLYRFERLSLKSTLLNTLSFPKGTTVLQYLVSFSNPMYQYMVIDHYIYRSVDGGHTWQKKGMPFNNARNKFVIAISDLDPNTIYILHRYKKGSEQIKKSTDGGESFSVIPSPNTSVSFRHILAVRGTDIIFVFGNNMSKVYYFIDSQWKEYSDDLPNYLTILEPKIQYRSGEFFMATSGSGIWTRRLPEDVLRKMNAIKINIDAPTKYSFKKSFKFNVTDTSLYYGKTITSRIWEFPGSDSVVGGNNLDKKNIEVIYNKYGRFPVKLTLTDSEGHTYTHTFKDYLTVYPYCACDVPSSIKRLLDDIDVWVDTSKANLIDKTITDRATGAQYSINSSNDGVEMKQTNNGHKVISFKKGGNGYIDLGKDFEGKTFFIVSSLDSKSNSDFSFLLGAGGSAHFHSGKGINGFILNARWSNSSNRFNKMMINNMDKNFFATKFIKDKLALYTLRTADNQTAGARYISKDRSQSRRFWIGDIAEVIIFNRQLTNDEIAEVNQYLMEKFGIQ